jgi:hypothetical protein
MITAFGLQVAPVQKAFADTQTRQEVSVKATRTKVVDYASGFDRSTPSKLKKHGVKVVVRYVGYQSGKYAWKNLTKSEAVALRKEGIDIVAVYETNARWMKGGYHAGIKAAKIAKADVIANGGPKDAFVYFACDEDAAYTTQVNAALRGAAQVLGRDKVGIYGSYTVVDSALKTRSAAKGWQTMAWSRGKVAKDIALYQTIKTSAGDLDLNYDSNLAKKDDIGQWGKRTVVAAPVSKQTSTTTDPRSKQASTTTESARKQASTIPVSAAHAASKPTLADFTIDLTAMLLNGVRL